MLDWTPPPLALALHLLLPPSRLRSLRVQAVVDHLSRALTRAPRAAA
jgi:hypothetical protein